ncbi:MAG: oxygenase MpaB family protein [Kineosporiaceae bacterium]
MPTPEAGLFGPDSVTWRVGREPAALVAGLRALFQQSLHPTVAGGFDALSDYRTHPWLRLTRTAEYVAVTTYGTVEQAERAGAAVRRGHARSFPDPGTGAPRRLDEPDLLLWVHACLVDSFLDVTTRSGLDLTDAERDRYVAEQVRSAELVGLDPGTVPAAAASLADHLAGRQPSLRLTPAAVDAVALLMAPPLPVRLELLTPARAGWTTLAALAWGSLPRWARERFPVPDGLEPLTQVAVTAGLRALRTAGRAVRAVVPAARRHPYESAARRRLGLDVPRGRPPAATAR